MKRWKLPGSGRRQWMKRCWPAAMPRQHAAQGLTFRVRQRQARHSGMRRRRRPGIQRLWREIPGSLALRARRNDEWVALVLALVHESALLDRRDRPWAISQARTWIKP